MDLCSAFRFGFGFHASIVKVLGRSSNATLMSVSKSYSRVVAYTKFLSVAHSRWKRSFDPRSSDSNVRYPNALGHSSVTVSVLQRGARRERSDLDSADSQCAVWPSRQPDGGSWLLGRNQDRRWRSSRRRCRAKTKIQRSLLAIPHITVRNSRPICLALLL
jgi:hypothetical protein